MTPSLDGVALREAPGDRGCLRSCSSQDPGYVDRLVCRGMARFSAQRSCRSSRVRKRFW